MENKLSYPSSTLTISISWFCKFIVIIYAILAITYIIIYQEIQISTITKSTELGFQLSEKRMKNIF